MGNRTRIKVVKNKIAPPFKEAEFDIMFGQGISREGDVLDLAANENIVIKSGAWYAYNDAKIGQGRENSKQFLKENPDIFLEIEKKVRDKCGLNGEVPEEAEKVSKKSESSKKAEASAKTEVIAEPDVAEDIEETL